jgi:hypothetical protein
MAAAHAVVLHTPSQLRCEKDTMSSLCTYSWLAKKTHVLADVVVEHVQEEGGVVMVVVAAVTAVMMVVAAVAAVLGGEAKVLAAFQQVKRGNEETRR